MNANQFNLIAAASAGAIVAAVVGGITWATVESNHTNRDLALMVSKHLDGCTLHKIKDSRAISVCRKVVEVSYRGGGEKYYFFIGTWDTGLPLSMNKHEGKWAVHDTIPLGCWGLPVKTNYSCRFITKTDGDYVETMRREFPDLRTS